MVKAYRALPVLNLHQGIAADQRGTRHRHSTKAARLSEQLKEQERIAARNIAIVEALSKFEPRVNQLLLAEALQPTVSVQVTSGLVPTPAFLCYTQPWCEHNPGQLYHGSCCCAL